MSRLILWFVKITGYPLQFFYFRKKVYFENDNKSLKSIKGKAIIISNHTSVFDFPLIMYTFLNRSIRPLVAEIIFGMNSFMKFFMKAIGGIFVDRKNFDFSFIKESVRVLDRNQVLLIFPESKVPTGIENGEFNEFKPSYVYIALKSGAPIVPVYTNGSYGKLRKERKENARLIVGEKIYPRNLYDESKTEKENIDFINGYVKNYIYSLREKLGKMN